MTVPLDHPLFELARRAGDAWIRSWSAMSGTDQAEGEIYRYEREVYVAAAQGQDVEAAIAAADARWRAYAVQNNARVALAPKIKRGPMSGHSAISYRWVSPDKVQAKAIHWREMIRLTANPAGERVGTP